MSDSDQEEDSIAGPELSTQPLSEALQNFSPQATTIAQYNQSMQDAGGSRDEADETDMEYGDARDYISPILGPQPRPARWVGSPHSFNGLSQSRRNRPDQPPQPFTPHHFEITRSDGQRRRPGDWRRGFSYDSGKGSPNSTSFKSALQSPYQSNVAGATTPAGAGVSNADQSLAGIFGNMGLGRTNQSLFGPNSTMGTPEPMEVSGAGIPSVASTRTPNSRIGSAVGGVTRPIQGPVTSTPVLPSTGTIPKRNLRFGADNSTGAATPPSGFPTSLASTTASSPSTWTQGPMMRRKARRDEPRGSAGDASGPQQSQSLWSEQGGDPSPVPSSESSPPKSPSSGSPTSKKFVSWRDRKTPGSILKNPKLSFSSGADASPQIPSPTPAPSSSSPPGQPTQNLGEGGNDLPPARSRPDNLRPRPQKKKADPNYVWY